MKLQVQPSANRSTGPVSPAKTAKAARGAPAAACTPEDRAGAATRIQERQLAVSQILASPTNPRKAFEPAALDELATSIRTYGVLQPILVRPAPGWELVTGRENGKDGFIWENRKLQALGGFGVTRSLALAERPYELVAGERRWRACRAAGVTHLPARICDLSDREVLEIQVIENEQRADTTDLERAAGYQACLNAGVPLAELCQRLGKSESAIRSILRLSRLPLPLADAVADARVPRSVAEIVCRLPSPAMRELAAACVLAGESSPSRLEWARKHKQLGRNAPLNVRETQDMLHEEFIAELKGVAWDPKDATLVPTAGACTRCPKLAGNNRDDFPDGRADVCTDVACLRQKHAAHKARVIAAAEAGGRRVLGAKAQQDCLRHGHFQSPSGMVRLTDRCYESGGNGRDYASMLGKAGRESLAKNIVLAFDHDDTLIELVDHQAAIRQLRKMKKLAPPARPKSYKVPPRPLTRDSWEVGERRDALLVKAVATTLEQMPAVEGLRSLAKLFLCELGPFAAFIVAKKIEPERISRFEQCSATIEAARVALNETSPGFLVAAIYAAFQTVGDLEPNEQTALATFAGVDLTTLTDPAFAEIKSQRNQ